MKPITILLLALALTGCTKTVPLTPKIGVDFGIMAVRIGGIMDVQFRSVGGTNDVARVRK